MRMAVRPKAIVRHEHLYLDCSYDGAMELSGSRPSRRKAHGSRRGTARRAKWQGQREDVLLLSPRNVLASPEQGAHDGVLNLVLNCKLLERAQGFPSVCN